MYMFITYNLARSIIGCICKCTSSFTTQTQINDVMQTLKQKKLLKFDLFYLSSESVMSKALCLLFVTVVTMATLLQDVLFAECRVVRAFIGIFKGNLAHKSTAPYFRYFSLHLDIGNV